MRNLAIVKYAFVLGLSILGSLRVAANDAGDTIPRNIPANQHETGTEDYNDLLKKGFTLINEGSVQQGVTNLSRAVTLKKEQDPSWRITEIFDYEFFSLVQVLDAGKLTKEEKTMGYQVVKDLVVNSSNSAEAGLNKFLEKNTKSVFARRLKFMYLARNRSLTDVYINKLLLLDSTIVSSNVYKGRTLAIENQHAQSIRYFSRAIQADPSYALAYYLRALSFDQLQEPEKAIADYNKAIGLYPNYLDAYNDRGNLLHKLKRYSEALADFKKAIALKPELDWLYNNIALTYMTLKQTDSALFYLQEALDINPRNAGAYNNRGDIYLYQRDYGSAVANFTKSINIEPNNKYAYLRRGDAYFYDDKGEQAMRDFEKAVELDKKNAYALMRIGDCYYKTNEFEKAIAYYSQSQGLYPDNLYLFISKGLCFNQIEKNDSAKECLLKAIAIDTTNASALGNLGWVYYCLGDFGNCISYSRKAIQYDDDAFYAMFNIALSTLRLGRYEESVELYKKYIAHSKSLNREISQGAISDLKDLVKKNIFVKESTYIIENVFQAKESLGE